MIEDKIKNKPSGHIGIFTVLRREIISGRFDGENRLPSESELARRFGVSRPTISRVMLDLKRVGLVITRQGARTTLSRFARNATGSIGLVVPGACYTEIFNPICNHIAHLAGQRGWKVIRGEIKSENPAVRAREAKKLACSFMQQRVAGILFQPIEFLEDNVKTNVEIIEHFNTAHIPVVLLDYDIVPPPNRSKYDLIGIDNIAAGLAVGKDLISKGARKITFLVRPGAAPTVTDRMRGVAAAVIDSGGSWSLDANVLGADPSDRNAVERFIRTRKPDAVVSGNDIAAKRLMQTLKAIGNRARRIILAGFDDVAVAGECGFTSVRQPLDDLAEAALQTLLMRIKAPQLPPRTVLLPAELISRR